MSDDSSIRDLERQLSRPFTPATAAVMRFAATILLVRDSAHGVEVFMQQRATAADFGGMYVFPGGKVDAIDGHDDIEALCVGLDDRAASAWVGVPSGGLAFWVAALRECFEECGVLLAYGADGSLIDPDAPAAHDRYRAHQAALQGGSSSLAQLCRAESLRLAVDRMTYFSHWITPEGPPRRYDTRFFIAAVPGDQQGRHDEWEATDSVWTRPEDALARRARGELQMITPTVTTLQSICAADNVAALLARVRKGLHLPQWTPEFGGHGMQQVNYPVGA